MTLPGPHFWIAEGLGAGGTYEGSAAPLIIKCHAAGVQTVIVQVSALITNPNASTRIKELRDAHLYVVGWDDFGAHPDSVTNFSKFAFDACVAQVEGPGQRDAAISAFKGGLAAGKPRGITTTYSGLENGQWVQLAAVGATFCITECYHADDPAHANISNMLGQGVVYGIPMAALSPVVGTWQGEMPSIYSWNDWSRNFGMWLAEEQSASQDVAWNMAGRTFWHLRDSVGHLLHSEWATTYTPSDDGLTRILTWMANNKPSLRAAGRISLVRETGIA